MSTGTLTLNFDTPDVALTGEGTLDLSNTFQALFMNNSELQEQIKLKIAEVFEGIKSNSIAKEWTDKIKKSLDIEEGSIDITKGLQAKAQEALKGMKLDASSIKLSGAGALKTQDLNKLQKVSDSFSDGFTKLEKTIKNFGDMTKKFGTSLEKSFKDITTKLPESIQSSMEGINSGMSAKTENVSAQQRQDTVMQAVPEMVVTDFSDLALEKLSRLFGKDLKKKRGSEDANEEASSSGGFLDDFIKGLLGGLGLTTLPALLKGLAGPALLAGGLLWLAFDGLRGWLKADEWGVSKIAGALGGALGGMGSGVEGAITNAGKGAAIGGGIGMMIGGPVGFIVGALVGLAIGGILGWIGGENLAKAFDIIGKKIHDNFLQSIGMFGVGENDPTRGLRKIIMVDIPLWFMKKLPSILEKNILKLAMLFEKVGMEKTATGVLTVGAKLMGSTVLKRLLKAIPFVGLVVSLGEAFDRFKNGNISGGLIAIASGMAGLIPGFGTGISILLDAVNMGLDLKYGGDAGRAKGGFNTFWKDTFMPILRKTPVIGQLMVMSEAIGAFSTGDWKEGLRLLAESGIIGIGGGLIEFLGGPSSAEILENFTNFDFVAWIKTAWEDTVIKIKEGFTKLFDWLAGLGDRVKNTIENAKQKVTGSMFGTSKSIGNDPREVERMNQQTLAMKQQQQKQPNVIKAQDVVATVVQPDKSDKFETIGAKTDGVLDKKLTEMIKILGNIAAMMKTMDENSFKKIQAELNKLTTSSQQQLEFMPALMPRKPADPPSAQVPDSDIRDPIYDYRTKMYETQFRRF